MKATIQPSKLKGTIQAPASKSSMQRACAAAVFIGFPRGTVAPYPPSTRALSPVTGSRLLRAARNIHGVGEGEYLSGHIFERQNMLRGAKGDRLARHPPHDARRLILCDGATARVQHLFESTGAVFPHTRENDPDGLKLGGDDVRKCLGKASHQRHLKRCSGCVDNFSTDMGKLPILLQ